MSWVVILCVGWVVCLVVVFLEFHGFLGSYLSLQGHEVEVVFLGAIDFCDDCILSI